MKENEVTEKIEELSVVMIAAQVKRLGIGINGIACNGNEKTLHFSS
jgi:hypothetical protein